MIFGTFDFFPFLALVVATYWLLKKFPVAQRLFLVLASMYYYWLIDSRFLGLLAILAIATYVLGRIIFNAREKSLGKFWLTIGIFINLGVLFWFKYYDFFRISAQSFFSTIGLPAALPYWEIIFPIGISFYTFRMISYLVDVKKGKIPAELSILNFSVYAFFFPIMLAGPLVRAGEFLPQVTKPQSININEAATLFFVGLFKKIVISSWLASALVDNTFAVPEQVAFLGAWLGVFGYALQIYCDFSGYSDIAVACAMFLGFQLSPNFLFPYKATSIADFWRRWHISFYLWMRDYVYIPLGGNRKGPVRNFLNIIMVFALSGLWHGAAWHFMFWGLWHGMGLAIERAFKFARQIPTQLSWLATFLFVSIGWILFRSENLDRAWAMITSMVKFSPGQPIALATVTIFLLFFVLVLFEETISHFFTHLAIRLPAAGWLLLWIFFGIVIYGLAPQTVPPFIYFSF